MKVASRSARMRVIKILVVSIVLILFVAVGFYAFMMQPKQAAESSKGEVAKPQPPSTTSPFPQFSEVPAQILIESIGVNARIISVGLAKDGAMEAPKTQGEVGWYRGSAPVGSNSAFSVLLDGHYGTDADPGVFYKLPQLKKGDAIKVKGLGGSQAIFTVVETEEPTRGIVDMKKTFYRYPSTIQSLTIITYQGEYNENNQAYDYRAIVYAERTN